MPSTQRHSGFERDFENDRTNLRHNGTRVGHINSTGVYFLAQPRDNVSSVTDITTAGNETYTAAQILTGIITRDPSGAGRTDTTDTASNLVSGLGLAANGDTWKCYLINTADAAETITLAAGTGVTITNVGQTLAQNESALLIFRRTSATAVTLYIVGA
jgi:hypothetical protein